MGLSIIMKRGGEDYHEYKKALKMAKKSIDTLCELTEDMEEEYGERGGYSYRDEDRDWEERGGRYGMRRYR